MTKRHRQFHLDVRSTPSKLGAWCFVPPGPWNLVRSFDKLAEARDYMLPARPTLLRPGTECRVRRTDTVAP